MVTFLDKIDAAIAENRDEKAVQSLERLSHSHEISEEDEITLGIMLMLPPLCSPEESIDHFRMALASGLKRKAAAWGAYVTDTLHPITEEFHLILAQEVDFAEGSYLLARHAEDAGHRNTSRNLISRIPPSSLFPNALLTKARLSTSPIEKDKLVQQAKEMTEIVRSPTKALPKSRSQIQTFYWSELIRGELMTPQVYEAHFKMN